MEARATEGTVGYLVSRPAPHELSQAYLVLTKNGDKPTDDNIAAGPAVIQIADNAAGQALPSYSPPSGGSGGSSPPAAANPYGTYSNYGKYDNIASYGKYSN